MKKYVLFVFATLFTVTINAANPFKIVSGSTSFLSTGTSASVEFDFSSSTWEKDETLKQQFKDDYEELINVSQTLAFTVPELVDGPFHSKQTNQIK